MPRGTSLYDEARLQQRLWTPKLDAPPSFWFDASVYGIQCDASGNASTVYDQGPFKNNSTQATTGARAAFNPITSYNSKPGLVFLANVAKFYLFNALAVGDVTLYAVAYQSGNISYRGMIGGTTHTGVPFLGFDDSNPTNLVLNNDNVVVLVKQLAPVGIRICSGRSGYTAGGIHTVDVDGATATATMTGSWSNPVNMMSYDTTSVPFDATLYEALIYPGRHTDYQMRRVQGYLAAKWRRPLAAGHLFAGRPPLIGD